MITSDGNGLRQSRTVGASTQQFVWDPNHAIPLLLDDGTHSYIYAMGATPIAQIDDVTGVIEYLHSDNVGSARMIVDGTGAVVSTTAYSPYGVVKAHLGTSDSAFGYASAWTDSTTGTDYLRAREYDPVTGQFLQVDPVVDATRQPYAYVDGAPLSAADPLGLCVGMDGTPQDRPCTANDFFWADLPGVVAESVKPTFAGLAAGSTFGVGLLTNNDQACYGDDPWFWISYGLGVTYSAVSLYGVGSALLGTGAAKAAASAAEGLSSSSSIKGTATVFRDDVSHIFRTAKGHLADDTAANRLLLQETVDPGNLVRTQSLGSSGVLQTFQRRLPSGEVVWVEVRDGTTITNGGVNVTTPGP